MEFIPRFGLSVKVEKNIFAMLLMVVLVGMGEHIGRRFLPIYLLALQGGVLSVGLLGGLDNLLGALYSFPGGYLCERVGYKRALQVFDLVAMLGYLVVIFFHAWWAVLLGAILFLSWSEVSLPATMSLLFVSMPVSHRVLGVSLHSFIRRVSMTLGPLLGGFLILWWGKQDGVRVAFALALGLALVSFFIQQELMTNIPCAERAEIRPWIVWKSMSRDLRRLLFSDILVRFCEQIPFAFVVVWCMENCGVTSVDFGLLTAVEMITAMLIYIPVARLADKAARKPFVVATFLFFAAFPVILYHTRDFRAMILAFAIRGLKEFGEPARKTLIMELSDPRSEAASFGVYYLVRDVVVSLAAFGGAFLWAASPAVNFYTASACGLLGALYFALFGSNVAPKLKS